MRLGWTEWAMTDGNETIGQSEWDKRFPPGNNPDDDEGWKIRAEAYNTWRLCGEKITDEGRRVLNQNRHLLEEAEHANP